MREVFIALGLALMLSSVGLIAWGAYGLRSVDRFEEFHDENTPDWWDYDYVIEPATDSMRSFYMAAVLGGLFLLVLGAALALHGWRGVKSEMPPDALAAPVAHSGERSFCAYCGGSIDPSAVRCPTCGRALKGG